MGGGTFSLVKAALQQTWMQYTAEHARPVRPTHELCERTCHPSPVLPPHLPTCRPHCSAAPAQTGQHRACLWPQRPPAAGAQQHMASVVIEQASRHQQGWRIGWAAKNPPCLAVTRLATAPFQSHTHPASPHLQPLTVLKQPRKDARLAAPRVRHPGSLLASARACLATACCACCACCRALLPSGAYGLTLRLQHAPHHLAAL